MLYPKWAIGTWKLLKKFIVTKGKDAVESSRVTWWFLKFLSGCKNDQSRFGKCKSTGSEASLQAIVTSMSIRRIWHLTVQGNLSPPQHHQKNLRLPYYDVTKIFQDFDSLFLFPGEATRTSTYQIASLQNLIQIFHTIYNNGTTELCLTLQKYCKTFEWSFLFPVAATRTSTS